MKYNLYVKAYKTRFNKRSLKIIKTENYDWVNKKYNNEKAKENFEFYITLNIALTSILALLNIAYITMFLDNLFLQAFIISLGITIGIYNLIFCPILVMQKLKYKYWQQDFELTDEYLDQIKED